MIGEELHVIPPAHGTLAILQLKESLALLCSDQGTWVLSSGHASFSLLSSSLLNDDPFQAVSVA
jgi:hypothetical protein